MDEPLTLLDAAAGQLARLAEALGHDAARAAACLRELVGPCAWAHRRVGTPWLPSGFRHRIPFGWSVVCGPRSHPPWHGELRGLVEAQAERPDAASYWNVGHAMTRWIGTQPGADLAAWDVVAPLFEPDDRAPFRVWHGVAFGATPRYRAYLCAGANAHARPRERVLRALSALDLAAAGRAWAATLGADDRPTILSLDLGAPARVKLYTLRPSATWDDLAPEWSLSGADPAGARAFVARLAPERTGWLTCCTLAGGEVRRVALHLNLARHLADHDAHRRLEGLEGILGVDLGPYRTLRALHPRPHFASLQLWEGARRLTTYALAEP